MTKIKPFFKHGFTLIEVLLGIIIVAIISLVLYNTFWMGLNIENKAKNINNHFQEVKLAFDSLARDLENIIFYDFSASYPDQNAFQGKSGELTFFCTTGKGIKNVRYYLMVPKDDKSSNTILGSGFKNYKDYIKVTREDLPVRFLMRQELSLSDYLAKNRRETSEEIIATAVATDGLKFQYGAKVEENGQSSEALKWEDDWDDKTLPQAVRISLTLFDPSNPKVPIYLVREIYLPRLDVEL